MSDFILIDGDTVDFLPAFAPAIVIVKQGAITGTGKATFNGKPVCVEGDESSVSVENCDYNAPPYMGGKGTLTIDSLGGDQTATKTNSDGKPVLLKGTMFTAKFSVTSPATKPGPPPNADLPVNKSYSGQGTFTNSNTKWTGT